MVTTHTVKAEPLSEAAFAPFGQVIGHGDMVMELRGWRGTGRVVHSRSACPDVFDRRLELEFGIAVMP